MGSDKPMDTQGSGGTGGDSDVAGGHGSHRSLAGVIIADNGHTPSGVAHTMRVGVTKIF